MKVNLSWPIGTIVNPVINATLIPKGGIASNISFTLTGDALSALYENLALNAGYYTLLVYLYDGTTFKWGAAEAVRIIKGQISEGTYPIIPGGGAIGDISLSITPDLQNPIDITFSGATDSLTIGNNMTLTAATSDEVETYQWYLNGKPLNGENINTITVGSALPVGSYRLDLLVAKNNIISSGTVNFTVTESGGATPLIAIASKGYHNLALKNDGTVWAWGSNWYGELGDGTTIDRIFPAQVNGLTGVTALAGGEYYSLALKNDGTVWAWGWNANGELGDGTNTNRSLPAPVTGLNGIVAITGGNYHSLALRNDGVVWAWGSDWYGELGHGTFGNSALPVQVMGLTGVTSIACGSYHSLALKNDGTVWAWGLNSFGQLGEDTATMWENLPRQVPGLTGVIAIAGGENYSLALKNDGSLWAWGDNQSGQLGDGTNTARYYPAQVLGMNGIISITAGIYHSVALKNDGTVWAWGANFADQLGDGTNIDRNLPAQVAGLSGITAIDGQGYHNFAFKNDGSLRAWGSNSYGLLGDGTCTERKTPVRVSVF